MLVVIITSRDFTLEDSRGVTGHVIEDDVSGGGAVQHLQTGHHEDGGAGVLGGNVTVELNLQKNSKLEKSGLLLSTVLCVVPTWSRYHLRLYMFSPSSL